MKKFLIIGLFGATAYVAAMIMIRRTGQNHLASEGDSSTLSR